MIPNLRIWLNRKHGDPDYYVTQFLSGHGGFKQYLHRFGLDESSVCPFCTDLVQDARHVFFVCPKFSAERNRMEREVKEVVGVDNIVNLMIASLENWGCVSSFMRFVLSELNRCSQRTLE